MGCMDGQAETNMLPTFQSWDIIMQSKVADCTKQTIKNRISQQFDLGLHGSLQNQISLLVLYV